MTRNFAIFMNALVLVILVVCVCLFLLLIGYRVFAVITIDNFFPIYQLFSLCAYLVGLSLMIIGSYRLRNYLHSKIQKPEVTSYQNPCMIPIILILIGSALIVLPPSLPKLLGGGCVIGEEHFKNRNVEIFYKKKVNNASLRK